jgi:hypothetical protein
MLSLAVLLTLSVAPLQVPVAAPDGSQLPESLLIEWLDKEQQPLREERISLNGGKLPLRAPGAADRFRVVGGGFSSAVVALADFPKLGTLSLQPTGRIRISGLRSKEGAATALFVLSSAIRTDPPAGRGKGLRARNRQQRCRIW